MGFMDWLKKILDPAPPSPPTPARKAPAKAKPRPAASAKTASRQSGHASTPAKTKATTPPFRPATPAANDARWIRSNEQVEFQSVTIRGGLVYIGSRLVLGTTENEPSLIDPTLPIVWPRESENAGDLPYWPAYARITPRQRGIYLRWLKEGRRDPQIPVGYAFLFLYGLERRVLTERQIALDAGELPLIQRELIALESLLGPQSASFRAACTQLIELIDLLLVDQALTRHDGGALPDVPLPPPPPLTPDNRVPPVSLRIGLSILARKRMPVPVDWALAWAWYIPGTAIRGPINRCPEEFAALFALRYREQFRDGIVLDPRPLKPLAIDIQPTNGALATDRHIKTDRLLDAFSRHDSRENYALAMLFTSATSALDDYSRWIARYPLRRHSLAAWSWLPEDARIPHTQLAKGLIQKLDTLLDGQPVAIVPGERIIRLWMGEEPTLPEKLARDAGSTAAAALGHLGYGLEPDPRSGVAITNGGPVALFRLPAPVKTVTTDDPAAGEYGEIVLLLDLAAVVAAADGEVSPREERSILAHLHKATATTYTLSATDERRVGARIAWQRAQPTGGHTLTGMRRRITPLTPDARDRLATGLLHLVDADGTIAPAEVTILQKIWKLLGRDPDRVASELHAIMTGGRLDSGAYSDDPVVVRRGTPREPGVPIPARPAPPTNEDLALDAATIARTMADSAAVSSLLGDLLSEEPPKAPAPAEPPPTPTGEADPLGAMLRALAARETWSPSAFAALAETHGLLPGAALDQVNEFAFETADDPLLIEEADGSLRVEPDILAMMLPADSV